MSRDRIVRTLPDLRLRGGHYTRNRCQFGLRRNSGFRRSGAIGGLRTAERGTHRARTRESGGRSFTVGRRRGFSSDRRKHRRSTASRTHARDGGGPGVWARIIVPFPVRVFRVALVLERATFTVDRLALNRIVKPALHRTGVYWGLLFLRHGGIVIRISVRAFREHLLHQTARLLVFLLVYPLVTVLRECRCLPA